MSLPEGEALVVSQIHVISIMLVAHNGAVAIVVNHHQTIAHDDHVNFTAPGPEAMHHI